MSIQKKGYKKNSPFKNRKSILINSPSITMKDVEFPVLAVPDGDKPKIMYPENEYFFPNSTQVMEYKMKKGGHPFENYLRSLSEKDQDNLIDYMETLSEDEQQEYMRKLTYGGCVDCEAKDGKWIQKAVKHPGRCTPGSPNYDCPKGSPQWRLAQTFKKHHGFHQDGGQVYPETHRSLANVEVEGGETALLPNESLVRFEGPKHSEGGIPTNLPGGTMVFSEHLKVPKALVKQLTGKNIKTKKSYADISKMFDTKKYEDILAHPDSDQFERNTATIKLATHSAALKTLFATQEAVKQKENKEVMQSGGFVDEGDPLTRLRRFAGVNYGFPTNIDRKWSATDDNKSSDFMSQIQYNSLTTPGFKGPREDWSFPVNHQEPSPTVTTGVVLNAPFSNDDVDAASLLYKELNPPTLDIVVPNEKPALAKDRSGKTKPKQVAPTSDKPVDNRKPFPNFDLLPSRPLSQVSSERGAPELPAVVNESQTVESKPNTLKKPWDFALSPKVTGTILDVLLANSDSLKVIEPTFYDQRKYPIMSRFVDMDNKEAERSLSLAISQVQNSDMPEQVKQTRIAELNAQYQNNRAQLDLANTERYSQKINQDLSRLEGYQNANIDQHRNDVEDYLQRKSRVEYLRDQFKAQKKSRTVNSLRSFIDYVEDTKMRNQLSDNYKVNPWTGKVEFKGSKPDPLKEQEEMLNQYQQNSPSRPLPNGASLTMIGPGIGIVTSPDGKSEIVKFN